jgi:hypothetical protein
MAERKMAKKSPMLSAPIPGQSLTAEPGSRPWEKPAKYTTVEETLKFYIEDLSQPKKMARLLDKIEEGAPLGLIVDSIQTIGVSKGLHTLDVGYLISPVLIEFMKVAAEQEGISPVIGDEDEDVGMSEEEAIVLLRKSNGDDSDAPQEEEMMEEEQAQPVRKGLMAPRMAEEEIVPEEGM